MAFAGGCGLDVDLAGQACASPALLFSEELGAVIQVRESDVAAVRAAFAGSAGHIHSIGVPDCWFSHRLSSWRSAPA